MIWPKIPGLPLTGYNGHSGAVARGVFMYNAGTFAAAHIPIGTPGFSALGDSPRMLLAGAKLIPSGNGCFPVDKLILQTEGADQDLDTIASGASLIYYIGGEYETDEYDITVSGTGATPGDKLWLNDSGQISLNRSAGDAGWVKLVPIGELVKVSPFPKTRRWYNGGNTTGVDAYKKTVWYRLYADHAAPMYKN